MPYIAVLTSAIVAALANHRYAFVVARHVHDGAAPVAVAATTAAGAIAGATTGTAAAAIVTLEVGCTLSTSPAVAITAAHTALGHASGERRKSGSAFVLPIRGRWPI